MDPYTGIHAQTLFEHVQYRTSELAVEVCDGGKDFNEFGNAECLVSPC